MPYKIFHPAPYLLALALFALTAGSARSQSLLGDAPVIDGLTVGGGLALFQGDLDANPSHNPLKLIGSGNVHALIGVDRATGDFRLGLEMVYDRLGGELSERTHTFTNNALSLDFVASYNAPFIRDGLLGAYLGIGPTLLINPTYSDYIQEEAQNGDARYKTPGTRVMMSLKAGFDFNDQIRLGVRFLPSDYVDGFAGIDEDFAFDMISTITLGYRFDL